jgi:hypothetical protein
MMKRRVFYNQVETIDDVKSIIGALYYDRAQNGFGQVRDAFGSTVLVGRMARDTETAKKAISNFILSFSDFRRVSIIPTIFENFPYCERDKCSEDLVYRVIEPTNCITKDWITKAEYSMFYGSALPRTVEVSIEVMRWYEDICNINKDLELEIENLKIENNGLLGDIGNFKRALEYHKDALSDAKKEMFKLKSQLQVAQDNSNYITYSDELSNGSAFNIIAMIDLDKCSCTIRHCGVTYKGTLSALERV